MKQPRWIDVGSVGIYLHKWEIKVLLKALDIARDQIIYDLRNRPCDANQYGTIESVIKNKLEETERSDKHYANRKKRPLSGQDTKD